jgi:hypothetical protein
MLETEWFCGRGVEDDEARTACARPGRVALTILVCGLGLALLGVIGGCATVALPLCPTAQAQITHDRQGKPYVAFAIDQLEVLQRSIQMEARGECVDPPQPAQGGRGAPV